MTMLSDYDEFLKVRLAASPSEHLIELVRSTRSGTSDRVEAAMILSMLDAAGIRGQKATPLFRTLDRKRQLTDRRMLRQDAWQMWKRRARQAGISDKTCCHTGRGTGLTNFILNGGSLDGRILANHASTRTTRLYVRVDEKIKMEMVERVRI